MKFTISIDTDGAAFEGDAYESEIRSQLEAVTRRMLNGWTDGILIDMNGNTVGEWTTDAD